jgi:phospholipase C
MGQTEAASGKAPLVSHLSGTGYTDGVPLGNDNNPPQSKIPGIGPYVASAVPDANQSLSVASLPVTLNPGEDRSAIAAGVTGLIASDLALEAKSGRPSVNWRWYEEGLLYPGDGTQANTWSQHHTAPLYFDYINNATSPFAANLRDNTPSNGLVSDIRSGKLPASGVFWVKGGNESSWGFKPADALLAAHNEFTGDDDHPGSGDSDHQGAEAYVATLINAIAQSQYWKDSVIILTWDDSGGFYDHFPPPSYGKTCPDDTSGLFAGAACGDGVRLPMLVISPFAKNGVVVHDESDAGSVSKFIEDVFDLPTLASLPDEAAGVSAGVAPADANAFVSDLTGALDTAKLTGTAPLNPAGLATIPAPSSPPAMSCATLGMTPISSPAALPAGFETSGYYEHQTLSGAATIHLPKPPDDGD